MEHPEEAGGKASGADGPKGGNGAAFRSAEGDLLDTCCDLAKLRPNLVDGRMLTAIYRMAYVQRHGPARLLRDMIAQDGHVMAMAGCTGPSLDEEDIAYTRECLSLTSTRKTCVPPSSACSGMRRVAPWGSHRAA
jgi:hypothetical protein